MARLVSALTEILAGLAGVVAAGLAVRLFRRTERDAPLRPRTAVEPGAEGPLGSLVGDLPRANVTHVVRSVELHAKDILVRALESRGEKPEDARLPPVLRHLLKDGGADAWWAGRLRAKYRGPAFLFPVVRRFRFRKQGERARAARYLDEMSKALVETVNP